MNYENTCALHVEEELRPQEAPKKVGSAGWRASFPTQSLHDATLFLYSPFETGENTPGHGRRQTAMWMFVYFDGHDDSLGKR